MLLVWIALAVLVAAAGGFILLLRSPVVVTVDTASGQMGIRWLALLTYLRPLPWAKGSRQLLLAGIPIPLAAPRRRKERKRAAVQPRGRRRRHASFLVRLLWLLVLLLRLLILLLRRLLVRSLAILRPEHLTVA